MRRIAIQFTLILLALSAGETMAAEMLVRDQQAYRDAVANARPGDTIVLANGTWRDFEIVFTGQGSAAKPISLTAQTKGQVVISGQSNLRLSGEYLHVSGLVFRDGHSPTNTVIAFRRTAGEYANHSRVSEVVIDHFNNPERHETDYWVMMYGKNNRFDHNHLEGKSNNGVTMAVRLDSVESQENRHRIDHNYFGPRPVLGSNGGETLRIGTSHYSMSDSFTTVEYNYFDRCDGEVEIISSKSGGNVFRGNVFFESRGTLTLRHGNGNLVEDNIFIGNNVDHTGGIRLINKRQTIRNNYMSGLKGYRFGGALVIMNGVPNSPINRYHQVEDSRVEGNTIVDSDHIEFAAGSDEERSAVPISTSFRNNLIVNTEPSDSIAVHDDISGIQFSGNVLSGVSKAPAASGFESRQVRMDVHSNGLAYPTDDALSRTGVSRSLEVLQRATTGPDWYPKPGYGSEFDGGTVLHATPGDSRIFAALQNAAAGDVIELAAGVYTETKILEVSQPVTIRGIAAGGDRPRIRFERTTLFEIQDGGSLRLDGVIIDGSLAPDTYGNSAVRTSPYSMLHNYQLIADNVHVTDLDVNHSFNFLKVAKHTFANRILIENSSFEDVSGHIVALDRETDDLGIYNAEYVTVRNSTFSNIGGSLASIYRGGTDESTFGPHFLLQNSHLDNVGNSKRNKSMASVFLLGVQVATIHVNQFDSSRHVRVVETVGDPITRISNNRLVNTAKPEIGPLQRNAY
tara:strand:- start:5030 stop:7249 length:2220 start_codon:yes stop_codon:yes gene_type:complete